MNAVGFEKREVSEVREKWKNIHLVAKKEFANYHKETRQSASVTTKIISKEIRNVLNCVPSKPTASS